MIRTVFQIRVYYEDTDFSGFVYHSNYLKYCERARSDFLRQKGVDQTILFAGDDKLAFVVRHMDCNFLRPARFGDDLTVETDFEEIKGVRMEALQTVKRGDETLFTAKVTAVLVNGKGRPARIPAELAAALTSR